VSALLLGTLLPVDVAAQAWVERQTLTQRRRCGIAYDVLRGRVVMFGGAQQRGTPFDNSNVLRETLEWDGVSWTRRTLGVMDEPSASDSTRGLVYDSNATRAYILNFPAAGGNAEFWRWEGRRWVNVSSQRRPAYRQHFAVAYDELRGRIVAWGGQDATSARVEIEEWDGSNWTEIVGSGPSGRNDCALAWDGVRGKIIMFGGRAFMTATPLNDMFEWNGGTWTQITPATLPPARSQHTMTWDAARRKVVLFGGGTGTPGVVQSDTWEWDGTNWTRVTTATTPPARAGHGATYHSDRRKVLITCGEGTTQILGDTWEFDGTNWVEVTPHQSPTLRSDHAMAHDRTRAETILFGGRNQQLISFDDTWALRAGRWVQLQPLTSPSARYDIALCENVTPGTLVLFGGFAGAGAQNDTWIWNGTTWTDAAPTTRPPARFAHGMAFDSVRGRVVLFGGQTASAVLNDTWEWNGTVWTQVTPLPVSPSARADFGMTFDSARNHVLVACGRTSISNAGPYLQDIWSFDGVAWTNRTPASGTQPGLRGNMPMVFDTRNNRAVMWGGQSSATTPVNGLHTWNGAGWTAPFSTLPGRFGLGLAWDSTLRRVVMFGGEVVGGVRRAETWVYTDNPQGTVSGPIAPAPPCVGPNVANIIGFGSPTLGNSNFALDLVTDNPPTTASPVFFFLAVTTGTAMFGPCQLIIDPATIFLTTYRFQVNGLASQPLPIPFNLALMNGQFLAQCLHINPPSVLNGLAFSAGARITMGD
jgi:hypothetical protein